MKNIIFVQKAINRSQEVYYVGLKINDSRTKIYKATGKCWFASLKGYDTKLKYVVIPVWIVKQFSLDF
jgi:hypothetical protein